ncbi:hypothetical protein CHS0354_032055 [Potamilus streckersoni]|uniref:Fe2OG dioxygenase domain-containing protein n=1 Tax=Potamilus streckersoni TaxID=2493646 RepID=A0AAE0TLI2_9BIVA|nr:hypothetical protein CHS0354_032055 [Potamilus streckersoni]
MIHGCPDYNISMDIITNKNQFHAGEDDVKGAAVALVRLWHTYTLDIDKLIKGQILDTKTDQLTPFDILYIAGVVEEKGQTYDAIVWLHALLKAIEERYIEEEGDIKEVTIVRRLAAAYSSHGVPWESVKLLEEYLRKDPTHKGVARDIAYINSKLRSIPEDQRTQLLQPPSLDDQKRVYEALCRGEGKRSQSVLSSLKCFSRQTKIPIYRAKEEVLNYAPRVSLFYEVISDSEIKYLKEAAMNLLARSYIMGDDGKGALADMRVSQTAWLPESSHPIVDRLGRRIELITGLSTRQYPHASHSEDFQILNYGIGGMYEPHPDWFGTLLANGAYRYGDPPSLRASGDRLATWLYYLEDVKKGGATVFVNLNVTVPVVKGAAAFWYNLKRNGELDENTWHAGCPVLLGSKWVSNKWIRETGQFFRRLCGKNPDSLDGPL